MNSRRDTGDPAFSSAAMPVAFVDSSAGCSSGNRDFRSSSEGPSVGVDDALSDSPGSSVIDAANHIAVALL